MSSDPAVISMNGLGKSYRLFQAPHERLLDAFFAKRRRSREEFWALRDVSYSIAKGQTVGVLGRNGSGKSTLLQLVAGTLAPTAGAVSVNGRVSAILELGAGFNPEFTGRENAVVSAALAGMSRRHVAERMQKIVDFADIGEFIDQPVKSYSSGMHARLAFAVAINVDPDILIVDEALSVGDIGFQARCFRKFDEFKERGVTILFVTHSVEQIARHCTSALLLDRGRLICAGDPKSVIARYLEVVFGSPGAVPADDLEKDAAGRRVARFEESFSRAGTEESAERFPGRPGYNALEHRWGNGLARIVDYALLDESGSEAGAIDSGARATLYVKVRFRADIDRPIYGLTIKTPDGVEIGGANTRDSVRHSQFTPRRTGDEIVVKFAFRCALNAGQYLISVGVAQETADAVVPLDRRYDSIAIQVVNAIKTFGLVNLEIDPVLVTDGAAVPEGAET